MTIPPRMSDGGAMAKWARAYNALRDWCIANQLSNGRTTTVKRTALGTMVEVATENGKAPAELQFKGEWRDQDYKQGDIVIRGSNNQESISWNNAINILTDGTRAGVYQANIDVPKGTPEPTEKNVIASQFWKTFARGSWNKLVITDEPSGNNGGVVNKITFDSISTPQGSSVVIKLADLIGTKKEVKFRKTLLCIIKPDGSRQEEECYILRTLSENTSQ